ncbi:MAG: A/G-specific adenine glycosylase [Flavobacteriaceae bacterium]|nr:A/G-specific adenine glycosylase [Flavobacteriaceae bacterium]
MKNFSNQLVSWYLKNKRDLPWRNTVDPYKIWLSEIMLQQTRVAQGLPYYLKFVSAFPSVIGLAEASEEEVLKLWQGLGYYSRARNLHATAKYVSYELKGVFPDNYNDLKKLKGVGDYTASAIASICYKEPKAVLDGNVFRVLARLYGIDTPINSPAGVKVFAELSQQLLDVNNPDTHNQAIMEFGARHCAPKKPLCESCIYNRSCVALKNNQVGELPVKLKKIKVKKRYFNYIVPIADNGFTILNKRAEKGIWANLYEFPLVETMGVIGIKELKNEIHKLAVLDTSFELSMYNEKEIVHKLSHQHIYTRFWIATTDKLMEPKVSFSEIEKYPVPVLIANFINEFSF